LYRPYYGYGALGYGGLGYGGYGGYGGYAPYYGGPAYASYAAPVTDPGYIAPAVASNPQESPDNAAHLQFNVPEGAEVWFDSTLTKQTGSVREYTSPPLSPGRRFTYKISVRYRDANGKEINDTRPIHVRANDWFSIDFTRPAPPEPPAQPKAPAAPPGEER